MKINKVLIIGILIGLFCNILGCNETDFEVPDINNKEIPSGIILSLNAIVSGLDTSNPEGVINFHEENQFVEGYVISSDREGNFFRELIIQDKIENPSVGLLIQLDERALYQRYPFGSKVRLKLKGLSLGVANGVVTIGKLKEQEIKAIDFSSIDDHLFRTPQINEIIPLTLELEKVNNTHKLLYVKVKGVQFNTNLIVPKIKTLAGESTDRFDGLRSITQCQSGVEIQLCTSTFASFKSLNLPTSKGNITGVLTRDFRDAFFVLKINNSTGLSFEENTRCDPVFFECNTINSFSAETILFQENFETITNENKLEPLDWFNINVTGDEKRWEDRKVTNVNNRTVTISAFNSNLQPLEAWLITPEISLENVVDAYLKFRVRTRFNTGKALDLWVTENFTGDVTTTQWHLLSVDFPIDSANFKTIIKNLSCFSNKKIRIAFQYKGYDTILTSTYEIDDVQFLGNKKLD